MAQPTPARLTGPDHLKAILLVLVIFGHTFEDRVSENVVKYVVYGFHMPMFLVLSGYLLNARRLATETLPQVARRYWSRMLWQWLAVSVVFEVFMGGFRGSSTVESAWLAVAEPRYHLWYVPVLMAAVVAIWVAAPFRPAHLALGAIALLGYLLFATPLRSHVDLPVAVDYRYFAFPLFVWLGAAMRAGWLRSPKQPWVPLLLVVVGALLYAYGFENAGWPRPIGFLWLNVGLGLLLPRLIARLERRIPVVTQSAVLLSTYSLWVYLLHPFATETLQIPGGTTAASLSAGFVATAAITLAAVALVWSWDVIGVRSRAGPAAPRRSERPRSTVMAESPHLPRL